MKKKVSLKKFHKKEKKLHHEAEKLHRKDEKVHDEIEHADKKKRVKSKGAKKIKKVMEEYKEGKLHSGSKKGPVVRKKDQAIAIALSEARKAGAKIPKSKKKK